MTSPAVLRNEPSEAEVRTKALEDYDRGCSKLRLVEFKKLMIHKEIGDALLPLKQFDGLRSNLAIYKWLHQQKKKEAEPLWIAPPTWRNTDRTSKRPSAKR